MRQRRNKDGGDNLWKSYFVRPGHSLPPARTRCGDPVYFQLFYEYEMAKRRGLEKTHEPDEIDEQVRLYAPMLHLQVTTTIGGFKEDEQIIADYKKHDYSRLFNVIEYVKKHERGYDPRSMLNNAFSEFGPPADVEERALKAEIAGDFELAGFLRKYVKA